jgi:CheY-like chemotaxis protein
VDDAPNIRETLVEMLRDGGSQVTCAKDGYEALGMPEVLGRTSVVLLDLMMPRMSGLEFLEHLPGQPDVEDVAIIVMSAHDGLRRQAERHASVRGSVKKPFGLDELLCLLEGRGPRTNRTSEASAIQ